jgi:serine/threonine-protein kinase
VVAALRLKLLPASRQERRPADPKAHDQYLLGLAFFARGSGESYQRAVRALRTSVELDPGFAQAWAALARALFWAGDLSATGDPAVSRPEALAAAEQAIALAPQRADGWFARGFLRQSALQDWTGAASDLTRARALNPGNPAILLQHATLQAELGQLGEAAATLQQAAALDPLSADIPTWQCAVSLGTGQLAAAEAAGRRALELSPEHELAGRNLGIVLLLQHRLPEALAAFHRTGNELFALMGDAMVEHALGHAAASQRAVEAILAKPWVLQGAYQLAQVHAWRGEADRAFEWLGHAVEQHDGGLGYLKYDPLLRPLRRDPRYPALLRRLALPAD